MHQCLKNYDKKNEPTHRKKISFYNKVKLLRSCQFSDLCVFQKEPKLKLHTDI
jgi:hypothetical protein